MAFILNPGGEIVLPVAVDHGQFIACDPDIEVDLDAYDDQAMRDGLAVWPGGVTVFTASHWTSTQVTVGLSDQRPDVDLDAYDHVVEAGLTLRTGTLEIGGPEQTSDAHIELPPGTYGLLVCGRGFNTTNEFDEDGSDTSALRLWPGPELNRQVRRDGFGWMDRPRPS